MPQLQAMPVPIPQPHASEAKDDSVVEISSDDTPAEDDESEEEEEIPHEDYQEVRDISLPPPREVTLVDAINSAPATQVKALLLRIVREDPVAKSIATRTFLASSSNGSKRKAYETCDNCGEDYLVDGNYLGACVYHEGDKEVDYDADTLADHDPRCHGDPEHPSLMNDPTYADGYQWGCCEQPADADGCIISRHVPKSAKRARY